MSVHARDRVRVAVEYLHRRGEDATPTTVAAEAKVTMRIAAHYLDELCDQDKSLTKTYAPARPALAEWCAVVSSPRGQPRTAVVSAHRAPDALSKVLAELGYTVEIKLAQPVEG